MTTERYFMAVLDNLASTLSGVIIATFFLCLFLSAKHLAVTLSNTEEKVLKWSFIVLVVSIIILVFIPR